MDAARIQDGVALLAVEQLYRSADLSALSFASTAEIQSIDGLLGQGRAMDAVRFGTKIDKPGFNLFVVGPLEARMKGAVEAVLKEIGSDGPRPSDWVYVQNFAEPHKPIAVELPQGGAPRFRDGMRELIDDLKVALPAAFRSEEYQTRRGAVDTGFQKKQGEAFAQLQAKASARDIGILRTPMGFALAPTKDGQIVRPEEFAAWPEEKRRNVQAAIEDLEKELERIVHQIPQWEKEHRDEIRRLNRETAQFAIGHSIEETRARFADLPKVLEHLERVRAALIDNVGMFVVKSEDEDRAERPGLSGAFEPYEVNVLVTREVEDHGVPIIEELHPTLGNLTGRIEYVSQQGVLVTNFRLIKAGALHHANGRYLLLDVRNLLSAPFSWAALKRV